MRSTLFYWYQAIAWLLVFAVITGSIIISRGLVQYEIYFALALIGTSALYSICIRFLFKKIFQHQGLGIQITYLVVQAFIGGSIGAAALILTVISFGYAGIIPKIPQENFFLTLNNMFWGNWFNMVSALILWSAAYLVVIKTRQVYAVKEALASAQLEALSQQLNPHFLFNTLNNIRAVILEDPQKARDALVQLSDMLRYTLEDHKDAKVSLARELAVTEEYIELCKIQFEQRLVFESDVSNDAEQALIPRMLLQLCVENAVKHGVAKLRDGGIVSLRVRIQEDNTQRAYLSIEVTNPLAPSVKINKEDDIGATDEISSGLGIKNIKQRLQLLYLNNQTIKPSLVMTKAEGKMKVLVNLPLEIAPDLPMTIHTGANE